MTATVHAQSGVPIGNVIFTSDGAQIGSVLLSDGVAVLNYSALSIGTHSIVAVYQRRTASAAVPRIRCNRSSSCR